MSPLFANILQNPGLFSFRYFGRTLSHSLTFIMGLSSYLSEPGFSGLVDFQDFERSLVP